MINLTANKADITTLHAFN